MDAGGRAAPGASSREQCMEQLPSASDASTFSLVDALRLSTLQVGWFRLVRVRERELKELPDGHWLVLHRTGP